MARKRRRKRKSRRKTYRTKKAAKRARPKGHGIYKVKAGWRVNRCKH